MAGQATLVVRNESDRRWRTVRVRVDGREVGEAKRLSEVSVAVDRGDRIVELIAYGGKQAWRLNFRPGDVVTLACKPGPMTSGDVAGSVAYGVVGVPPVASHRWHVDVSRRSVAGEDHPIEGLGTDLP
jgi:hypothetical protein